ncbi:MAG: glycosyltransferase 87 family protein [Acidimicrobiales bacterium]
MQVPPTARRWSPSQIAMFLGVLAVLLGTFGWLLGAFDLEVFLAAARQVVGHQDPYPSLRSASFLSGHAFVYPYVVAWAFVTFAWVPTALAVAVNLVLSVGAIVAGCALLGRTGLYPVALVLVASTTIIGLQMGTLNAFLFLGLAVAWSQRRRALAVGVAVGVIAVSKLFLVPMILWLVAARRYRAAAVASAVAGGLLVLGWLAGPIGPRSYLQLLSALQHHETARSWSLTSFLQSLGAGRSGAQVLVVVAAAAIGVWGYVRFRRSADERVLFCLAIAGCLVVSPIVWSSYLLLLAVPLLLVVPDCWPLAAYAVASWALVTPDQASAPRVIVGAALAVMLSVMALGQGSGDSSGQPLWRRPAAAGRRLAAGVVACLRASRASKLAAARVLLVVAGAVGVAVGVAVVPARQRNALPALLCVLAATLIAARAPLPAQEAASQDAGALE